MPGQLNSIITKILSATYWQWLVLLVGLVVLVRLVMRIRASLREDDDPSIVDHQMLVEITELQRQGEITEGEYRSIKSRLVDRLNKNDRLSTEEPKSE